MGEGLFKVRYNNNTYIVYHIEKFNNFLIFINDEFKYVNIDSCKLVGGL